MDGLVAIAVPVIAIALMTLGAYGALRCMGYPDE